MKILIHACCAPCLTYPLRELRTKSSEILVLCYNPNVQPFLEYELRRDCLTKYCEKQGVTFVEGSYDFERFFQDVVFREQVRCSICYKLRLTEAAKYARQGNFDYFTTTLLVSPYQEHEMLRDIGQSIGQQYGVPFLYQEFRSGWRHTISVSSELGLYRQKYCGCLYSEKERYRQKFPAQSQNKRDHRESDKPDDKIARQKKG